MSKLGEAGKNGWDREAAVQRHRCAEHGGVGWHVWIEGSGATA